MCEVNKREKEKDKSIISINIRENKRQNKYKRYIYDRIIQLFRRLKLQIVGTKLFINGHYQYKTLDVETFLSLRFFYHILKCFLSFK